MPVSIDSRAIVTLDEAKNYISSEEIPDFSNTQEDEIQRIINWVSNQFEKTCGILIKKKNISMYKNGISAGDVFLPYMPVWAYDEGGSVLISGNSYDYSDATDILFRIYDTEDEEYLVNDEDWFVNQETGAVTFYSSYDWGIRRYRFEFTAGLFADTDSVSDEWKEMALMAVNFIWNKEQASFTRAVEGVALYPRTLPPAVSVFLDQKKRQRI